MNPSPRAAQLREDRVELRTPAREGGSFLGKIPLSSRSYLVGRQGSRGVWTPVPSSQAPPSASPHAGSAPAGRPGSWPPCLGPLAELGPPPACHSGQCTSLAPRASPNTGAHSHLKPCCPSPEGDRGGCLPRSAQPGSPGLEGGDEGCHPDPGQVAPRAPALARRWGK